jgi:hypothetical protein
MHDSTCRNAASIKLGLLRWVHVGMKAQRCSNAAMGVRHWDDGMLLAHPPQRQLHPAALALLLTAEAE